MVMKMKCDRSDFVCSALGEKQKKQNVLSILAVILFFVLSAFTFMNFLYCFSDCIGSIVCGSADVALRDALRSVPIFLSFFLSLSGLMTAQAFYRNESAEILQKRAKKHAAIGVVIGVILIVYVIAMRFAGKYLSLAEGAPSLIYPLDAVIYAVCYVAGGICVWVYFAKYAKAHPYAGPTRAPIRKKGRVCRCIFRTFWLLIALYGFCGFFYSFFIVDFSSDYVSFLPYNLAVMCVSLVVLLTLAVWELYYNNLTEEKRKEANLPLALISLAASLAAAIFYAVALINNLNGASNVGFGVLPVAFSASVNIATVVVVLTPVLVSVSALVKGIARKAKAEKR